jgi:hypothetical protein
MNTFFSKRQIPRSFTMLRPLSTIVFAAVLFAGVTSSLHSAIIDPISATASGPSNTYGTRVADNTINGSELSGIGPVLSQGHDATSPDSTMWLTDNTQTATIQWDLGAQFSLTDIHMWNYNEYYGNPSQPFYERGVQTADVQVSKTGLAGSWTDLGVMTFLPATGSTSYSGSDYPLAVNDARYVQFNVLSSFGGIGAGDNYTGISEIRFVGGAPTPEPASFVLCGLGAVGLLVAARRRRQA